MNSDIDRMNSACPESDWKLLQKLAGKRLQQRGLMEENDSVRLYKDDQRWRNGNA